MMKKLLILVAFIATTGTYGQYSLDFEDTTKYGFAQQSNGAPHVEVAPVTNPVTSGINSSATSLQFTETVGALQWEFGFLNNTGRS